MVINIVNANVPCADAVFLLFVEVYAEVEAVVVAHAEVVAFKCLNLWNIAPFVNQAFVNLGAKGATVAAAENPSAGDVETVTELVLHGNTHIMATVIFGRKHLTLVDFHALAVELAVGVCPSITNPARGLAERTLHKELNTVCPAFAETDLVIPSLA